MESEWQMLSLQEVNVSLVDCDHRTPPAAVEGYPYVAIPQLKEGRLDLAQARKISFENFVEWTRKARPIANDIVLSRRCNPGETAFVSAGMEFALGQNLVLLRADGTKIFPPFLRWLVRGPQWWEQVGKFINVGAVFDSLKCADIPKFQLRIPPLPEQRAIAHILGALDDKIELNRKMNAMLESLARALFQSWFVDFDPIRAKAEGRAPHGMDSATAALFPDSFEESALGGVPRGWRIVKLGDIADVNWGDTNTTKSSYTITGFPAFSASGQDGLLPYHDHERTGVVVSAIGANAGITWLALGKWSCIKNTIRFWSISNEVSTEYIYLATLGKEKWPLRGSAQPFIAQGDARAMQLLIPNNSLAIIFGDFVRSFFQKIQRNSNEITTLTTIRDALLPKLLSGEIRVGEAERIAEGAL
jgi:type I restriction enzyme, S subunit